MKKTYITRMPDKAGAFLLASRIVAKLGGNIVRVNYNRAIDTHTLFLEVEADEEQHAMIAGMLKDCGYLSSAYDDREILMIVLTLRDEPGAVTPVLEVIGRYKVNISYISSREDGSGVQHFKMGLLIENAQEISGLIEEISKICEISILDYEVTDRLLDGTVFYVSFANEMRRVLSLTQEQTNEVLIQANGMMQLLDEQKKPVLQTFDYIRRFAQTVVDQKGEKFALRRSERKVKNGMTLHLFEPPCGSNTYVLDTGGELVFIDSGFCCYREEMLSVLRETFSDFDARKKEALITHADVDHVGLLDLFDRTYMTDECRLNFVLQTEGKPDFREQYRLHAPYCALSKIISSYHTPDLSRCAAIGGRKSGDGRLFVPVGSVTVGGIRFTFLEGKGGHVRGEALILSEETGLLFSGDVFVNVKGFFETQKEFNRLAPFLMTGVDVDPPLCAEERAELLRRFGDFLICPGHGAIWEA